ncbi:MAG TPA: hypothetical protein VHG91_00715 [Longimicrobium sp.]|nr:hypothetical protein [Longimicrobium sp.]
MPAPPRIQRLIDGRQMEPVEPDADTVAGFWTKALASSADSRKGLHPDNAVSLAYQAAFQASSAVLECAGYRVRGAQGHHHNTYYALSGLGLPGLEGVDVESERIRKLRTAAFYGADVASPAQVEAVHRWLDALLPAARQAIVTLRPDLAARLPPP